MIPLPPKKAQSIQQVIQHWRDDQVISDDLAATLKTTIAPTPFDWARLALYSFLIAMFAFVIAVISVFADKALMKLLAIYFNAPALAKAVSLCTLSGLLFAWGAYRKQTRATTTFQNDALFCLGVLLSAGGLFYIGQWLNLSPRAIPRLFLAGCLSYGILGILLQSTLIWTFALLSLSGWIGAQVAYQDHSFYFFNMMYPRLFVVFGALLTLSAIPCAYIQRLRALKNTTLIIGLIHLLAALWLFSICGVQESVKVFQRGATTELLQWALVFGAVAIGTFLHGLKFDNSITRGFGLFSILINLYTQFFEYCFAPMHKAVFFALLGASFWLLGAKAEKIWNLTLTKKA